MEGEIICIELLSKWTYFFQITVVKSTFGSPQPPPPSLHPREAAWKHKQLCFLAGVLFKEQGEEPSPPCFLKLVPPYFFFIVYQVSSWWVQTSSL